MEASKSHLKYIQVDEDNGSIFKFVKEKIKNAKRISIMHETDWIIKCYLNTSQPKKSCFLYSCVLLFVKATYSQINKLMTNHLFL